MRFSKFMMFLVTTIAASQVLLAGNSGGGGNAVVCPGGKAELLDIYEARILRSLKPKLGPANLDPMKKVKLALKSLAKIDPYRSEKLGAWAASFFDEATFGDFDLISIEDSKHKIVPAGCKIVQTVNQQAPEFPGDKRYLIDNKVWKLFDNDSKAATILHEVIYRETMANRQTDSRGARYFNAQVFSLKAESMTVKEYFDVISDSGLLYSKDEMFFADGVLYQGGREQIRVNDQGIVTLGFPTENLTLTILDGQQVTMDATRHAIVRHDNGAIARFMPVAGTVINAYGLQLRIDTEFEVVQFSENGNLLSAPLKGYHTINTSFGPREFIGKITFFPNGSVADGMMWSQSDSITVNGNSIKLKGLNRVYFDQNGRVKNYIHQSDEKYGSN